MVFKFRELKEKLQQDAEFIKSANVRVSNDNNGNHSESIDTNLDTLPTATKSIDNSLYRLISADDNVIAVNILVADNLTTVNVLKVLIDFNSAIIRLEVPYSKIYAYKLLNSTNNKQWILTLQDKSALYKLQRGMRAKLVFEFNTV